MNRWAAWVVIVLLVLLAGAGLLLQRWSSGSSVPGASTEIPKEQVFKMNLGTEPPTLDAVEAEDLVSITVLGNIMRGLTQYGEGGAIVPDYAESWEQNPDGRLYTFHLRKNGRWSDGKPVTAQDFVYGWKRVLNPENGSPYAFLLFSIKNARALYEGKLGNESALGFKALDSHTLQVELEQPVAYFLEIMAFSISYPHRQDVIEKYGERFTEAGHLIGNGPYVLSQWEHENQIFLKPNPYYWAGTPQNNGVQMVMIPEPNTSLIMYENNELDFVETTTSLPTKEVRLLKGRPDFHQQTLNAISYFGFNTQRPPFDDVRVRKAFIHAFDRTYIPRLFQGGEQPIKSWISPSLEAYNPQVGLGFDVEKARRYLAEAGYPDGKGFPAVQFLYANNIPENRQIAEIAQYQWKKHLGVAVEIQNVEWKVFLKQLDQEPPHIFRLQWYVDYPDPDSFMNVFISDSGNSHIHWTNKRYDRLVAQAAVEQDPVRRKALYDQVQRILLEEAAGILPLYVIPKTYLLKQHVRGFHLNELNNVMLDNVTFGTPASNH